MHHHALRVLRLLVSPISLPSTICQIHLPPCILVIKLAADIGDDEESHQSAHYSKSGPYQESRLIPFGATVIGVENSCEDLGLSVRSRSTTLVDSYLCANCSSGFGPRGHKSHHLATYRSWEAFRCCKHHRADFCQSEPFSFCLELLTFQDPPLQASGTTHIAQRTMETHSGSAYWHRPG